MPKTPETGDTVVWMTDEGALCGIVSKIDQFGVNITDEDNKKYRVRHHDITAVVLHVNRLKLAYALSSALRDHRARLDASHLDLENDRWVALDKFAI